MKKSRRNFIKAGLGVGATVPFALNRPFALAASEEETPPPFLLHIVCEGGWDPSIVFDNKIDVASVATMTGATTVSSGSGITHVGHSSMPNTTSFFSNYGSKASIINGINCFFASHENALKQHLTVAAAKTSFRAHAQPNSYVSYYAQAANPGKAAPHLVLGGEIPGGGYDASVLYLDDTVTSDLLAAVPNTTSLPDSAEAAISKYLSSHYSSALGSFASTGLDAEKINNLALNFLREQKIGPNLSTYINNVGTTASNTEYNIKLALEFMASGNTTAATIKTGNRHKWDSHKNNMTVQAAAFEELFSAVAAGISYATSKSLDSNLIILISSEMGRTPSLNIDAGKDHWPYSSALIWSPLIAGKKIIGATDDYLRSVKTNLTTGLADSNDGELLTMEHIFATIYYLSKIPAEEMANPSRLISALIPT